MLIYKGPSVEKMLLYFSDYFTQTVNFIKKPHVTIMMWLLYLFHLVSFYGIFSGCIDTDGWSAKPSLEIVDNRILNRRFWNWRYRLEFLPFVFNISFLILSWKASERYRINSDFLDENNLACFSSTSISFMVWHVAISL